MIAVVIVNLCAGYGPWDWQWWVYGCIELPSAYARLFLPIVVSMLACGAAAVTRRGVIAR